ncbi:MAG: phosphomannomutase, partial [Clostridia bacterium]|nr:phosphomannomutase [Clostridia bacterium]
MDIENENFSDENEEKKPYKLDREILREYDIRGIFGKTLFPEDARKIGQAFGTLLIRKNLKKICVGRDCRISSPALCDELITGLVNTGVEVTSLGICHTPLMYYYVNKANLDGGIMVTGSHNPPEHNGFKFVLSNDPFYGE